MKKEENELVTELKKLCDYHGREIDPSKTAELLHRLGLIYWKRSPDKLSLMQAAALFNAAIVRKPANLQTIQKDLHALCTHVLKLGKAQNLNADLVETSKILGEKVKQMRKRALLKLEKAPSKEAFANKQECEKAKVDFVQALQDQITDDYVELMKQISDYGMTVMGEAPCPYSHIALGSLARKEVTPFSDFESIIVLKEGVQKSISYPNFLEFFRWFTVIYQIVILNFGETIIPSVAIPSLNNFLEKGKDWFFDVHTPRGISFDGLMPHASKNPLGRQQKTKDKPWKTELIKPISFMLDYLQLENDLKNGYHLADILTTTRFVTGDQTLHNEFKLKLLQLGQEGKTSSFNRLLDIMKDDLESYAVFDSLAIAHRKRNFNTKRMVYRSSTIFISTLGKMHHLKSVSSFDIISELEEKEIITSEAARNLKFAIAVACDVRLRAYLENQAQSENLPLRLRGSNSSDHKNLDLGIENVLDVDDALLYFKITFCLQKNIRAGYQTNYSCDMRTVEKHVEAGMCFCFFQYQTALEIGKNLRKLYLAEGNIEKVIAFTSFVKECLYLQGDYPNALKESRYELLQELQLKPRNAQNIAKCHQDIAKCLLKLELYLEAAVEFEKEFTTRKSISKNTLLLQTDMLNCIRNIANAYYSCHKFEEALVWFQIEKQEHNSAFSNHILTMPKLFGNIGGCFFRMNRFEEALDNYHQAKAIGSRENLSTETTAYYWNKIGHCNFKMNKYEEALSAYEEELKILRCEKQTKETQTKIIDCLGNLAISCHNLGRHAQEEDYERDYQTQVAKLIEF